LESEFCCLKEIALANFINYKQIEDA